MEPEEINPEYADYHGHEGSVTRPGGEPLPKVLDPVMTMGVVQKYLETERDRNRRALLWVSTGFLLVATAVLVLFVSIGIVLLRKSRRAAISANEAKLLTQVYVGELSGISNKISTIEKTHATITGALTDQQIERARDNKALKSKLEKFSSWVAMNNKEKTSAVSTLEDRLSKMEKAAAVREKEVAAIMEKYDDLVQGRGSGLRLPVVAVPREADIAQIDIPDIDIDDSDTTGADVPDTNMDPKTIARLFENISAELQDPADEDFGPPEDDGGHREIYVVRLPNGDRYEGAFKDGLFSGWGVYYYRNGDRYEGEFDDDMKNGKGTLTYRNGDKYSGDFKDDVKEGRGSLQFSNGDKYVGRFRRDMMSGKGTMLYKNRNKYVGDFRAGAKHGNGVLSFFNGDVYKGEFRDDARNGLGTYAFKDGAKYVGGFKDNKRHGTGRYIYAGGEEYVGEFMDGKKHGVGISVYPDGRRIKGIWKEDEFLRSID